MRVLLAVSEKGPRRVLAEYLRDFGDAKAISVDIAKAAHAEEAQGIIDDLGTGRFDLVVIGAHIRLDGTRRSQDGNESLWLALLKKWRLAEFDIPSILVFNPNSRDCGQMLAESQLLPRCQPVPIGHDIRRAFINATASSTTLSPPGDNTVEPTVAMPPGSPESPGLSELPDPQKAPAPKRESEADYPASVEIKLISPQYLTYQIFMKRSGSEFYLDGPIELDWWKLEELCQHAKALEKKNPSWETILHLIGDKLADLILQGKFKEDFLAAKKLCPLKNIHIRFHASEDIYGVIFEALRDEGRYLMLEAPMARKVPERVSSDPLELVGGPPINVLFIAANVQRSDRVNGFHGCAPATLENLAREQSYFENLRQTRQDEAIVRFGKIDIISDQTRSSGNGLSFRQELEEKLTGGAAASGNGRGYDIVHFAGHFSSRQEDQAKGEEHSYLVLPGDPLDELDISTFADWLQRSGTKFIYLSSCRSSAANVAFELAHRGIPAVAGFRWDLPDDLAFFFAKTFYDKLFYALPHFDEAFLEARLAMMDLHGDEPIWASPILILQPRDWHRSAI